MHCGLTVFWWVGGEPESPQTWPIEMTKSSLENRMRYTLRYACHLSEVTQATVLAKTTLFAHFEAREAERCPNIFPSCSAQRKGKGVGYQKRAEMGLADLLVLGVLADASPVGE